MNVRLNLSEERIRSAHKTAGVSTQKVLQELWPWLKDRAFKPGQDIVCNDGTSATVIGYSDDLIALAYFKSLPNTPAFDIGFRLLAMSRKGHPRWAKEENYCHPGGIYDHG